MKHIIKLVFGSLITIFFSASEFAVTVSWTDWTSSDSFSATGDLLVGSTTVVMLHKNRTVY